MTNVLKGPSSGNNGVKNTSTLKISLINWLENPK